MLPSVCVGDSAHLAMELAIDTSTKVAGIALSHEGNVLAEHVWRAEQRHTVQLMPAIEGLLAAQGLAPRDLGAVIVAIGPGGFSGLRVGVSTAKGLGAALGVPVVGVGTLAAEAHPFSGAGLPVCPVLDAGREEMAAAVYSSDGDGLREVAAPRVVGIEALCGLWAGPAIYCGEHLPLVKDQLGERLGPRAHFPPASALIRRPGSFAELGWRKLSHGGTEDVSTLQPLYLRPPSITSPRQPKRQ